MKITVKGKEIDLEKALPIVVGDLRKLKKLGVHYPDNFDPRDIDQVVVFLFYFLKKVDSSVTEEEVDSLLLDEVQAPVLFLVSGGKKGEDNLDRPISGESTTLPITTDGVPVI